MLPLKDLLKRSRKAKKLTQQQISDLMKVHRSNYSRLETGKLDMTHTMIKRFCDAINITMEEFYKEESIENEYKIKINSLTVEDREEVYKIIDAKVKTKSSK